MKKKLLLSVLWFLVLVLSFSVNKTYAYSYYASWTNKGDFASNLSIDVDDDVWDLYSWFFKEVTVPTDTYGGSSNDMGNIKMWVGVYHTSQQETVGDVFLILYQVNTSPEENYNGEDGYTDYLQATSNIDYYLGSGENNYLLEYGPEDENNSYDYNFGIEFGVTPDGPEFSVSFDESITIYDMSVDSTTSDPNFNTIYDYENSKSNSYADSEHSHGGYMIIDSDSSWFRFYLDFEAQFSDFDWFLSRDTSTIESRFYFGS